MWIIAIHPEGDTIRPQSNSGLGEPKNNRHYNIVASWKILTDLANRIICPGLDIDRRNILFPNPYRVAVIEY